MLIHCAIGMASLEKDTLVKRAALDEKVVEVRLRHAEKYVPHEDSRHVEEERRNVVSRELRDLSKNDLVDHSAYKGLGKIPEWPKNCLLVD